MRAILGVSLRTVVFVISMLSFGDVALAQTCNQSFAVKKDTYIENLGWLPGAKELGTGKILCADAEWARNVFYVDNASKIDVAALATSEKYMDELNKTLARALSLQKKLDEQLEKDALIGALVVTYRVLKYEAAKVSAILGCAAPEPTISKVGCAWGLWTLGEDTVAILDGSITKVDVSKRAETIRKQLGELQSKISDLKGKTKNFNMPEAQKRLTATFIGMCEAVKKSCL